MEKHLKKQIIDIYSPDLLFIDTETTSLDGEVIQLSIIDIEGNVLFNQYIKPAIDKISQSAFEVHNISQEFIDTQKTIDNYVKQINEATKNKTIVYYNADFDIYSTIRSIINSGIENPLFTKNKSFCLMEFYAEYFGDWNDYFHNYTWQKLYPSCKYEGIDIPDNLGPHNSLFDTELTRRLFLYLYNKAIKKD